MTNSDKQESFFVKYKKELLIGFIAVLSITFIAQNSAPVDFWLVFFKINASLIFLLVLFFLLGASLVWVKYYFTLKEKNKKIKELEEELKNYKA
jgi:uncharacterized integral membrane protein